MCSDPCPRRGCRKIYAARADLSPLRSEGLPPLAASHRMLRLEDSIHIGPALWHGLLTVPRQPTVGLPGIPWLARGPGDLRSGWVARSGDRATTRVAHCFRTLLGSARTDWTRSPARSRTGWNVLRYFQIHADH